MEYETVSHSSLEPFVPIDAKMPDARLEKIIENLSPALVITLKSYAEKCAGLKISNEKLVFIDEGERKKAPPQGGSGDAPDVIHFLFYLLTAYI